MLPDPFYSGGDYYNQVNQIISTAQNNISTLGNAWYPQLAQALADFDIDQTLMK